MKIYNSGFYEVARVRQTMPRFRFRGEVGLPEWQEGAKKRLAELLGLPLERGEEAFSLGYVRDHTDFTEYRFEVECEPRYFAQCYLLVPNDGKEKHNLAICFGGHGSNMHITAGLPENDVNRAKGILSSVEDKKILSENPELNMASSALKSGRAALVIESRAFGEAGDDIPSCTENAKTALLMGRTLIGERVWDAMRVLDTVLAEFSVNEENITVTGFSGGGTLALYFSCIDSRISTCAISCSLCSFEGSIVAMPHCLCNHIPGIRREFEICDVAGMLYPRRLIAAAGESDPIFPIEPTRESFDLLRDIYYKDNPERCTLLTDEGGHSYYSELIWSELDRL